MPGGEQGNRFRCRPVLRRHDSAPKFRSPFRSRKVSFSLQTGAPSRKKEANGPRRRAKVANRCRGVNWGWRVPGGSRGSQKGPRGSQRVPKGVPKVPKRGPKGFQKGFQRVPKGIPKDPREIPKGILQESRGILGEFPERFLRNSLGILQESKGILGEFPEGFLRDS